ncbi:MAG: hypothetical protein KBC78_02330 [Candidatus Pacebacteria bacterium]|nr:hypothetical protein [Candidatus Paceibacterota bacterium]
MTYLNLSRRTGSFALITLFVLISFLFTTTSIKAQEVDITSFDLEAEDADVEVQTVVVDTENEEDVDSVIQIDDIILTVDTEDFGSTTEDALNFDDELTVELTDEEIELVDEFIAALDLYICHATDNAENGFMKVSLGEMFDEWGWDDVNAYVGHLDHGDDIVPTATVEQDVLDLLEISFPGISLLLANGQNLDIEYSAYGMTGLEIHEAGCEVSAIDIDTNTGTSTDNNATSTDSNTSTTTTDTTDDTENTDYSEPFECEIEGHKYDQNGNPLSDWQIGLMKIITQDEKTDIWDLAEDITDNDGYYCLEWDGETRVFRGVAPTITAVPYDFTYHVYEKLVSGWSFLSIEKGSDVNNLLVVDESDTRYDGDYISTQIGETNGYIYTDAAYHVDFYNKKVEETPVISGGSGSTDGNNGGSGGDNNSSSTRVGDRNSNSNSNPKPRVLGEATSTAPLISGEQVTVVPYGAPNTGAGGTSTSQTLTLSQILYISRRAF